MENLITVVGFGQRVALRVTPSVWAR